MEEINIIAAILFILIVPQIFLLDYVRILDIKLFQFFTFINLLASNSILLILSLLIFTVNIIMP